jgi:Ca2+-transporting ATPase
MILLDDNFATIVAAISGGRHIYDNIRRFIRYMLTTNFAEVLVIMLAPLLGLPLPLLPIQILWINLVTDGMPGLALTMEPPERNLMQRPPRPPGETLFAQGLWQKVLWTGLLMALLVLGIQYWSIHHSGSHWQTMVFTALTFTQLGNVLVIRSDRESLLRIGLASNPVLLVCVASSIVLHLLLVYLPWLNSVFSTEPLTLPELLLCGAVAVMVMLAVEVEKWMIRRGWLYRTGRQRALQ